MGFSTSSKVATERSAMQMTAVYSCVRILAEAVAGLEQCTGMILCLIISIGIHCK